MRFIVKISAVLAALLLFAFSPTDGNCRKKRAYLDTFVDTIMTNLRNRAKYYHSARPDYEAFVYVRSNADILKRNILHDYIPYLSKAKKGINHYEADFLGTATFTNPNMYNQIYFPITPNKSQFIEKHMELIVPKNMKLNVYSQYLTGGTYSPLAYKSWKYYRFKLDSIWQHGGHTYYKIHYAPKFSNYKFVQGYLITSNRNWGIREMHYRSGTAFVGYTNHVKMGKEFGPDEFLPAEINMNTKAAILGNHLIGEYNARINYKSIKESHIIKERGREKYNLTQLYNTRNDTLSSLANYIKNFRDSVVMADMPEMMQTEEAPAKDSVKSSAAWSKMGSFFIKDHSLDLKQMGELRLYPLISPVLFNYSSSKGLSYTQKFKYRRVTPKDRLIYIEPRIGYNFKYKEFYWGVKGELNYSPRHMSRLFIDIGNGNKIKTDKIRNELAKVPFMVFDSTQLNLRDFRNSYAKMGHKIEVSNGFTVSTNLSVLTYHERNSSNLTVIHPMSIHVKRSREIARNTYRSFVPEIELTYTPHQYYRYNGHRKEYLYSRFPTFTINYAKAIKGVLNSTTGYNRIEFDMNQQSDIGPMHRLFYRIGAGAFINYTDLFFAEFNFLRKNNLPSGWDDDIGGAFQLLSRHKYNEIDKYLRANVRYDAPILLLSSILRKIKYINKEKLYCNLLFTDIMDPYIEMGYGVGTHLFNVGVFWGGEITRWDTVGIKFSLEFE